MAPAKSHQCCKPYTWYWVKTTDCQSDCRPPSLADQQGKQLDYLNRFGCPGNRLSSSESTVLALRMRLRNSRVLSESETEVMASSEETACRAAVKPPARHQLGVHHESCHRVTKMHIHGCAKTPYSITYKIQAPWCAIQQTHPDAY